MFADVQPLTHIDGSRPLDALIIALTLTAIIVGLLLLDRWDRRGSWARHARKHVVERNALRRASRGEPQVDTFDASGRRVRT